MKQSHRWTYSMLIAALSLSMLSACTGNVRPTAPGESPKVAIEEARQDVRTVAGETLNILYSKQPEARAAVEKSAGYAIFSNFGMKILVAGGGKGEGLAVNNKTKEEVFMRMAEIQAGLGFGVKKFRLVWVFQTQEAFNNFVNSGYEFGGHASLSAQRGDAGGGLAGALSVSPGVWVYQITDDGISAELTVKGTKYYRDKELN